MKRKLKTTTLLAVIFAATMFTTPTMARDMNIYVSGHKLVRNVCQVDKFDMLPVLDIAGELGFEAYTMNDTTARFYNDTMEFYFELGDPAVYNNLDKWIGLDIVPQYIDGKFMIPAKFFQDVFGYSYVWDSVTDTLFLNSDNEYHWLINTDEYKNGTIANPKRDEYTNRLNKIDNDLTYNLNTAYSTNDMLSSLAAATDAADVLLNEVYGYLKSTMPADEFSSLQSDEIAWISARDAAVANAGSDFGMGSGARLEKSSVLYEQTFLRCEYLISIIK